MKTSPKIKWKTLGTIGKYLIAAILIFFIVRIIVNSWQELRGHTFTINWGFLVLSFLVGILSYVLQAVNWHLILKALGIQLPISETSTTWFYSMMAKYIPGKVFQLFGRIILLEKHKVSKKIIGVSFIVENAVSLISSSFFGILFILFRPSADIQFPLRIGIAVGLFIIMSLILISPRVLEAIINLGLRILKREQIRITMTFKNLLGILLYYTLCLAVYGVSFILFIMAIEPSAGFHQYFVATGAFNLYSILNTLAFFTPNGVGFGEISLIFMLGFFLSHAGTIAVSVTIRLFIVLIELVATGLLFIVDKLFFKRDKHKLPVQGK